VATDLGDERRTPLEADLATDPLDDADCHALGMATDPLIDVEHVGLKDASSVWQDGWSHSERRTHREPRLSIADEPGIHPVGGQLDLAWDSHVGRRKPALAAEAIVRLRSADHRADPRSSPGPAATVSPASSGRPRRGAAR
jgi:hypothetical protein